MIKLFFSIVSLIHSTVVIYLLYHLVEDAGVHLPIMSTWSHGPDGGVGVMTPLMWTWSDPI